MRVIIDLSESDEEALTVTPRQLGEALAQMHQSVSGLMTWRVEPPDDHQDVEEVFASIVDA